MLHAWSFSNQETAKQKWSHAQFFGKSAGAERELGGIGEVADAQNISRQSLFGRREKKKILNSHSES